MDDIAADLVDIDLPKGASLVGEDLPALYRNQENSARRKATRQGIWAAVFVYLLFSVSDLLLIFDVATYTIGARFAIGSFILIAFELQYRNSARTEFLDLTCAAAVVVGYWGWLCPAMMTSQTQNFSYYMVFGAIFMMGANLFFYLPFKLSVIASGLILCAFFIALYNFPASPTYRLAFGLFYLSCFTFTSYVNWKLNRERYNVFLNAMEAKLQQNEAAERGKALLRLSRTDPLTGLENRRAADERLRDYWDDWQKRGINFAAVLIDVDFFKRFNDCYGHQQGDRCLSLVASAIEGKVKQHDGAIARYGGEEFIALVRKECPEQVEAFAEAIRKTVEKLAILHEQRRDGLSIVTVSVGSAIARDQTGAKLEKIIQEADRALYLAKANGRNCSRLFDPRDPHSSDESENIAAILKVATGRGLVSLVYQPIRSLATGEVEAVEALMRLRMLDGTSVPPSLFIPVAERTGAILELGRWAIRTVCLELLVDNQVPVASVNVSPIQLKAPGFATSVAAILVETGVTGDRLALEITEGLEMEMRSDVLRCINDLKQLGVKVWLDDFGTGFAGLSWLRLIDFDTVKIDRSFLHDSKFPRGRAMLQDIIGLIRNRGHRILVEGVETSEQLALMSELGINLVQGFYVGRPAPATTFTKAKKTIQNRGITLLKSA